MNLKDKLANRIPVVRFESAAGDGSRASAVRPWHELTEIPGFTFYVLRLVTWILPFIGLIMVFSASTIMDLTRGQSPFTSFFRPLIIVIIGLVAMVVISRLPYRRIIRLAPTWAVFAVAFQLSVFSPLGMGKGGNRNWVNLGITQFQPSELLKLAFVLWLAWAIGIRHANMRRWQDVLGWVALPTAVAIGVVMAGHDMGTAMIFVAIVAVVVFVAGMRGSVLVIAAGALMLGAGLLVGISPSRRRRVVALFSSTPDPQGNDLQTVHAQWGLGTGGLLGVGPGASRQKWNYLPEAHTDFIFAILGEEFGFVGTTLVILLFILLAYGLYRLMATAKDPSVRILAAGVAGWLLTQALINILVVVGWAPVIGVPLPFVSSGGSSLLSSLAAMGVILSCAREEPGADKLVRSRIRKRRPLAVTNRDRGRD